jgi:hypothetical protein
MKTSRSTTPLVYVLAALTPVPGFAFPLRLPVTLATAAPHNNNNYNYYYNNSMKQPFAMLRSSLFSKLFSTTADPSTVPATSDATYADSIVLFGGSAPAVPNPDKEILGGKGLGLQEMSSIGILVPPGFTLTTPLCQLFDEKGDFPTELWTLVDEAIAHVEADMERKFGDASGAQPLLFSCRSGAKVSCHDEWDEQEGHSLGLSFDKPLANLAYRLCRFPCQV